MAKPYKCEMSPFSKITASVNVFFDPSLFAPARTPYGAFVVSYNVFLYIKQYHTITNYRIKLKSCAKRASSDIKH